MLRKNNGITLIALVITIIVLLILAGVSISAVMGENGIATKAKEAGEKTETAKKEEELERKISEIQLNAASEDMDKAMEELETLVKCFDEGVLELGTGTPITMHGYFEHDGVIAEANIEVESDAIEITNYKVIDKVPAKAEALRALMDEEVSGTDTESGNVITTVFEYENVEYEVTQTKSDDGATVEIIIAEV